MNSPMNTKGFSLIELMVVLLIIAILAAMAIPVNTLPKGRKQVLHALEIPEAYKTAITTYYRFRGKFPESNETLGIPLPDKLISTSVVRMTLEKGAMHVELGNKVLPVLKGKIISVQPVVVTDSPNSPIDWVCAFAKAPEGMEKVGENKTNIGPRFAPSICR